MNIESGMDKLILEEVVAPITFKNDITFIKEIFLSHGSKIVAGDRVWLFNPWKLTIQWLLLSQVSGIMNNINIKVGDQVLGNEELIELTV